MEKPNIIYILGDDHRQDLTELAQHEVVKTPNLNAMAKEGYYFKNSFCTSPACTPSRACHYLGQWERTHGINFNSKTAVSEKAWNSSFPVILKNNGYQTAWIGKNHVPIGDGGYSSGYMETSFDYWYGNHGHSMFYPKEKIFGEMYSNAKKDTQIEIFEEGAMNFLDPQKDFIENATYPLIYRDKEKPFCMCVTFNLPHCASTNGMQQRESDDEIYKSLYRDKMNEFKLPHSYVAYDDISEPRLPKNVYSGDYLPEYNYVKTVSSLAEAKVRFCQTITGMDRMIGHLREKLTELGIEENTIIIFSTDHGVHHGEHGIGGKCFLYEEDIKIPLVIYDPRNKQSEGKIVEQMTVVPDIAPTVLELMGIEVPKTMQGKSLVPILKGENVELREEIFLEQLLDTQNYPRSEAVRTKDWKYIRYFKRTEIPNETRPFKATLDNYDEFLFKSDQAQEVVYEELFDLKNDKYEDVNLAKNKKYDEKLNYFRKKVESLVEKYRTQGYNERVFHGENCANERLAYVKNKEE